MNTARDYLAAVQQRADAATDGPWGAHSCGLPTCGHCNWIARPDATGEGDDDLAGVGSFVDAEFIAAARTDVPRLVAFALAVLNEMDDCFQSAALSRAPGEYTIDPRVIRDLADEHLTPKENDS